jgi:acyl-coenzyme A thioesterase PaaI-like protein
MTEPSLAELSRIWRTEDPKRLVGPGHPVGDFLEAPEWEVLERNERTLRLRVHLPDQVKNPRGDLFGGFTPTYADFVALHVFHLGLRDGKPRQWLSTASLQVEYFTPIQGPHFEITGELLQRRGRSACVQLRFLSTDGELCALGQATLIEQRAS